MMARGLVGNLKSKQYEENCKEYDEIIKMFAELGSGKMSRIDVLNNITSMVHNGLLEKLDNLVTDIKLYEEFGGLFM